MIRTAIVFVLLVLFLVGYGFLVSVWPIIGGITYLAICAGFIGFLLWTLASYLAKIKTPWSL